MEQNTTKTEKTGAGVKRISTKLKFIKSDKNGALISFVSQNKVNQVVCGVRQDSPYPKKIVILDVKLAKTLLVNILYDCELIPMPRVLNQRTGEYHIPGYIAIQATPVQFKATVSTSYIRGVKYMVEVSFGNKTIRFDPFKGQKESVKSFNACRAVLQKRCDVKDLMQVVADFENAATTLMDLLKEDMREINNKKSRNGKTGSRNRH